MDVATQSMLNTQTIVMMDDYSDTLSSSKKETDTFQCLVISFFVLLPLIIPFLVIYFVKKDMSKSYY